MAEPIRVVDANGRIRLLKADLQRTLAQALFLEGLWPTRPFCAGLGRCGLCAVRFAGSSPKPLPDEAAALSREALEQGGRLACRRQAEPGLHIVLPFAYPESSGFASGPEFRPALGRAISGSLSLAVDLGTTSLHWQVQDQRGVLARGQELNPQLAAGSEVMSRLGFALIQPQNAQALQDVVLQRLHALTAAFPRKVETMCVAGNTVMTALLLGWPLQGLAVSPYTLPHAGGIWTGLFPEDPDSCETYIPPMPAPFIGADISAGLTSLYFKKAETLAYPFLLADLGTNGEFILALDAEHFLAASVPMGPALEGIGMTRGSTALPGVWVDFRLSPRGLQPVAMPDPNVREPLQAAGKYALDGTVGMPGQRISGTGYLALLAGLRRLGLVGEAGGFAMEGGTPLARRVGRGVAEHNGEWRFVLGPDVFVTGRDVEEVLKVKAAFNLAFSRLLEEGGVAPHALRAVYLAGALGYHVGLDALEELGFVPSGLKHRICPAGNTSLAGAALLARSGRARDWIEQTVPRIVTLNIGQEKNFFSQFIQRVVFRYV